MPKEKKTEQSNGVCVVKIKSSGYTTFLHHTENVSWDLHKSFIS